MARTSDSAGQPAPPLSKDHFLAQLGIRRVRSDDDAELTMEVDCTPQRANSRGGLQGGIVATLVDVVAGLLALEGLPADDVVPATTNLAVTYLAGITKGPARASARIVRRGSRAVVVQVDVHDVGADRLAAVSTVSFMVVPLRPTAATDGGAAQPGSD